MNDRREVIRRISVGVGALWLSACSRAQAPGTAAPAPTVVPPVPPPLEGALVKAFVGAAHSDLAKVKGMLADEPHLINATWDWKAGDFETALGGASHMGRADIASYLLSHGARLDLFCAAMLGKIEVVRACVADDPTIVHVKGPHGISLLRHAQAGKHESVAGYLRAMGAT